jgi:type IV secretion system protein VirB9
MTASEARVNLSASSSPVTSGLARKTMNGILMAVPLIDRRVSNGARRHRAAAFMTATQNISHNSQNTTVINTRAGYITTLVFDADEEVITATAGFPQGWTITPDRNRVGISPRR